MSKDRFAEEFKQEAVRQVVERGYTDPDVAKRPGVSVQSLYKWVASGRTYGAPRILCDLREFGERVGKNRVAKIMQRNKIFE